MFKLLLGVLAAVGLGSGLDHVLLDIINLDTLEANFVGSKLALAIDPKNSSAKSGYENALSEYSKGLEDVIAQLDTQAARKSKLLDGLTTDKAETYRLYKDRYQEVKDTIGLASINIRQGSFDAFKQTKLEELGDFLKEEVMDAIIGRTFNMRVPSREAGLMLFSDLMNLGMRAKARQDDINVLPLIHASLDRVWSGIRLQQKPRMDENDDLKMQLRINKIRKDRVVSRREALLSQLSRSSASLT